MQNPKPLANQDGAGAQHVPVLLEQSLHYLQPRLGESYLDATAGYGGHAAAVLRQTQAPERAVLVDRDTHATHVLAQKFGGQGAIKIVQQDFYKASRQLATDGVRFDMILADLGVSSPHLNQAERGFSLIQEGPLDMRMDQGQSLTAADIVNFYAADDLAEILQRYGEDPKSRQIAKLIVEYRKTEPFTTTTQLAQVVSRAWMGKGHSKIHPATRTFQALRIAVNDELHMVELSLPLWVELLAPKGRLVVISFHSLEDRLVKRALAAASGDRYDATLQLLTKRPVVAEQNEIASNPRSRSAKLRAAVKT